MTELPVLKTPAFGDPATAGPLPYRIDRLAGHGYRLVWDDRRALASGPWGRVVGRLEALTTPFLQTWHLRRALRRAPVALAFFESEGHGFALARLLGFGRRPMFVVMSCWLGEIAPRLGRIRRALYRRLYRRIDLVTVFSANQVPILGETLGIPAERIGVLPFGIDAAEVVSHPTSEGDYLLAAGRDAARDWPTLFAAVAGTGRRVVVLARPSRLPDAAPPAEVEIVGYVDRARYLDLLAGCAGVLIVTGDVAYPSGQTVLMEALALRKRCVVTDTAAMRSFGADLPWVPVPVGDAAAVQAAIEGLDALPAPQVPVDRLDAAAMWAALATMVEERRCVSPR